MSKKQSLPRLPQECLSVISQFEQSPSIGIGAEAIKKALKQIAEKDGAGVFQHLLLTQLLRRMQSGKSPTADEYRVHFPQFSEQIDRIFAMASSETTVDYKTLGQRSKAKPDVAKLPDIPGYEIIGELGRGGMGVVFKATQIALKRTVALKMVRHHFGKGSPELARFQVEAETIARLQHPNIVQVFQVGLAEDMPFLAMEFLDGGSLGNRLKSKKMTPHKAASLVETLARAMHLAHSRNVVHRDLKPANVLLAKDGTPKIADFGLARQLDVDSGQTHTGAIMGTPSYMAPEQASGETHRAGPAADVYALGAILYECLTGRPPFKGANIAETLEQVCNNEPRRPSVVNASVPIDLETICLKCLRKEPEHRYSSAEALADDVNRFLGDEPIEARPVGTSERIWRWCRRKPALAITSASAILGVMLAIVVLASAVIVVSDSLDKQTIERKKAETIGAQYKALAKKEENSRVEAEKQRDAAKLHFLKTS